MRRDDDRDDDAIPAGHEGPVLQLSRGRECEIALGSAGTIFVARSPGGRLLVSIPPPAVGDGIKVHLGGETFAVQRVRVRGSGSGRFKFWLPDWAIVQRPAKHGPEAA